LIENHSLVDPIVPDTIRIDPIRRAPSYGERSIIGSSEGRPRTIAVLLMLVFVPSEVYATTIILAG